MSVREIRLSVLLGRRVRDAEGRTVGRLHELVSRIELRPDGRDYVVGEAHVRSFGALDALTGSGFARHLLQRFPLRARRYCIPWDWMDFSDPRRPVVTRRVEELEAAD